MFKILKYKISNQLLVVLILSAIFLSFITYYSITKESNILGPDPHKILWLILADLIVFLILAILLMHKVLKKPVNTYNLNQSSRLQNRIIIAFSLVAAIPTIIIAIFSAYFFNFGLQAWFDKKIATILDQSIIVARSYIDEHKLQLKETALSTADDLNSMYYDLIHNSDFFSKTLNAEAEMRSLNEAIVFQSSTNVVLAQTALSFSLSFSNIPTHLIERADKGEIVEIKSDKTKIRMMIKLREYHDTYLIIGRLIDKKIINHVNETNGAAKQYNKLKKNIASMQINFSIIFILIALLLLLASISWGVIIAGQIVSPILKLVTATEKIKNGDLTTQVREDNLNSDELKVLSIEFNRMIRKIDHQQKDLVIAQRALAWSDVARRVAHEIKNPLTPIQLAAGQLLKKFSNDVSDSSTFVKYIQTIDRHVHDIQKIVSDFIYFARMPSPTFSKNDLVSVIYDMLESRRLINQHILYEFETTDNKIDFVCDATQINQVMVNLLKNAEESFNKHYKDPAIKIAIEQNKESITVTIRDNGIGFSKELINKAAIAYITTRSKGTGLGLSIVKKIIQDHNGTMQISNNSDAGANIKLIFQYQMLKDKLT